MIDHLPCSVKTSDNPDRYERITKASSYEGIPESETELEIREEVDSEDNSEVLKYGYSSDTSDPDDKDTAESWTSKDNCVEENRNKDV